ncbi:MAG: MJ0042-type zinc finger domain-containing protein, partial [Bradyrhizobium sp.]
HCTTSYAINPATLGVGGRTVRCSRCKEVWLARPEDAMEAATAVPAMAEASQSTARLDAAAEWQALGQEEEGQDHPLVDSPSISADWPAEDDAASPEDDSVAHEEAEGQRETELTTHRQRLARLFRLPALSGAGARGQSSATLPTACAAMGALILALVIWRADVVRLLPQTALFYKMVGLDVNLRGLAFKDIKVTNETVDGQPVLVIEGVIVGETRKPVDLPRLRFSVRDAQDLEIYAWNAVLEQPMLKPGERAFFKSRLASPPPDGRNIDVRFFNKRDLAGGHA